MKIKYLQLTLVLTILSFTLHAQKAVFLKEHSCEVDSSNLIDSATAEKYYLYFKDLKLFSWKKDNNNCEDRANAVSILLDNWKVPNYKVWIFSGSFLNKDAGQLIKSGNIRWKYHVAAVIPFLRLDKTIGYVTIDPGTTSQGVSLEQWADGVTDVPNSYFFLTNGDKYIFKGPGSNISGNTFFVRDNNNLTYTMQGLAGVNGANTFDRILLPVNFRQKRKIAKTKKLFEQLMDSSSPI